MTAEVRSDGWITTCSVRTCWKQPSLRKASSGIREMKSKLAETRAELAERLTATLEKTIDSEAELKCITEGPVEMQNAGPDLAGPARTSFVCTALSSPEIPARVWAERPWEKHLYKKRRQREENAPGSGGYGKVVESMEYQKVIKTKLHGSQRTSKLDGDVQTHYPPPEGAPPKGGTFLVRLWRRSLLFQVSNKHNDNLTRQNEWLRSRNGRLGTGLLGKILKGVCSAGKYSLVLCPSSDLDVMFLAPTASCEDGSHVLRTAEEKARQRLDSDTASSLEGNAHVLPAWSTELNWTELSWVYAHALQISLLVLTAWKELVSKLHFLCEWGQGHGVLWVGVSCTQTHNQP
ncbi:hypothetical protein GH733_016743 [Mirounga leonina]|nr:hypothetical protein GH733_016743 [Mirounga leonina]